MTDWGGRPLNLAKEDLFIIIKETTTPQPNYQRSFFKQFVTNSNKPFQFLLLDFQLLNLYGNISIEFVGNVLLLLLQDLEFGFLVFQLVPFELQMFQGLHVLLFHGLETFVLSPKFIFLLHLLATLLDG